MQLRIRSIRSRAIGLLGVGLLAMLPTRARGQVLDQVPSDAALVVRVKNTQDVSTKFASLCKKWGLDQMVPELADPLASLLEKAKISAGVNKSADAAVVMTAFDFEAASPPVTVYVPVSDYAAFIANFADAKKDGDLDVVHMEFDGKKDNGDTFVAHWGNYAVITPNKDLLAKKPAGFKPTGASAKEFDTKDIVEYVNFKVLGPQLLAKLKESKPKLLDEIDKGLAGDAQFNQKFLPTIKAVVGQGFTIAEEFLTDAQAVTVSVNLSDDGVATSLLVDMAPDSYTGGIFSGLKNTDAPLLAGLPDGKYWIYGGSVSGGPAAIKLVDDILDPIVKELTAVGEDGKPFLDYISAVRSLLAATKGSTFGAIAPTGMLGASPLIQVLGVYTGNPAEILAAQKTAMQSEQQLMTMIQSIGGANAPKTEIKFTTDAKELDGVKFNQFTTTFDGPPNSPQAAQVKQMMAVIYGPNGASGYSGAIDDQHVLFTVGVDDATMSAAIKSVKANQDNLSNGENLALVNKYLPKSRLGVFYLPVDVIFTTVANYAKMMGMPIPVNMKPNLPPVATAVSSDGPTLRFDTFVPSDLVQEIIATALKFQMMKNGRPGQPGGL